MKNKKALYLFLHFTLVLLAVGAASEAVAQDEFYTPKSLLIPLHDQKNQLHVSVGRGGGYDVNVSYAFTDKLAIFSTVTLDNGTKRRIAILGDRYNVDRNDHVLRGGLGYFTKTENKFLPILEFYAGGGISKIDNYRYWKGHTYGEVTQAQYWTTYAQVQAGKKFRKADYGFGLRLAYSRYTQLEYYDRNQSLMNRRIYYDNVWGLTAEPGFSFSYKLIRELKLNLQSGLAIPVISVQRQEFIKDTFNDQTFAGSGTSRLDLFAFTGRLSLQYTLNFSKKEN